MMRNLLQHTRRPDITFNSNGRIFISSRVVQMLSINPGDTINIATMGMEYMLYARHKTTGRHIAQCYPTKKGSRNFCANSVILARAILTAVGCTADRAAFMVGESMKLDDTVYCPIITRMPL